VAPDTGDLVAFPDPAAQTAPPPPDLTQLDPPEGSIACVVCGRFCKKGIGITAHMRKHTKRRKPAASRKPRQVKSPDKSRPKDRTEFDTKLAIDHTPGEVAFVLREMARKAQQRADKLNDLAEELDAEAAIGQAVRS
jgi:hypothetical protein